MMARGYQRLVELFTAFMLELLGVVIAAEKCINLIFVSF